MKSRKPLPHCNGGEKFAIRRKQSKSHLCDWAHFENGSFAIPQCTRNMKTKSWSTSNIRKPSGSRHADDTARPQRHDSDCGRQPDIETAEAATQGVTAS
jgi:hypothetical protein